MKRLLLAAVLATMPLCAHAQLATLPTTPAGVTRATPAVQAAAYASGASIGGLMTFFASRSPTNGGLVQSVAVAFLSGVTPALDIVLFNANPSASTITDKATISIAAADVGKVVGVIHVSDCTLLGASSPSVCQGQQQAMPFIVPTNGAPLYVAVVARAAVTLTSASDMTVSIAALQN